MCYITYRNTQQKTRGVKNCEMMEAYARKHFSTFETKTQLLVGGIVKAGWVYSQLEICVLPILAGEKEPTISWSSLTYRDFESLVLPHLTKGCQLAISLDPQASPIGTNGGWRLLVLDIDCDPIQHRADIDALFEALSKATSLDGSPLSETLRVITGSGRFHFYLLVQSPPNGNLPLRHKYKRSEGVVLEARYGRQYVLAPPSLHPLAYENGIPKPDAHLWAYRYQLHPSEIDSETGLPLLWVRAVENGNLNPFEVLSRYIKTVAPEQLQEVCEEWEGKVKQTWAVKLGAPEKMSTNDWDGQTVNEISTLILKAHPRLDEFDKHLAQTVAFQFAPLWKEGSRQDLALRLVGYVVKSIQPTKPIVGAFALEILSCLTEMTGDLETSRRTDTVRYTIAKALKDEPILGSMGLKQMLGEK